MNYKIMVVDDEPANLRVLERLLGRKYHVISASSGNEALSLLREHDVALLITDQRMPGMTGIELLKRTVDFRPHMVRIILTGYIDVSALVDAINCGQVYKYITKPWNNEELGLTVNRALEFYETNKSRYELEATKKRLQSRLVALSKSFVRSMADTLLAKDDYLFSHSLHISNLSLAIANKMDVEREDFNVIEQIAMLHNLGHIATPDDMLHQYDSRTSDSFPSAKEISKRTTQILSGVSEIEDVADGIRYFPMRYDGLDSHKDMIGEMIPFPTRIVQVAEGYATLTKPRFPEDAISHEQAIDELKAESGKCFDPAVVSALSQIETLGRIQQSIERWSHFPITNGFAGVDVEKCTYSEIVNMVMKEPALALKVIKYRSEITGKEKGIKLREICLTMDEASLKELVIDTRLSAGALPLAADRHARYLRCAEACRLLAEQTKFLQAQEAYTLGLLYNWGEELLWQLFPQAMRQFSQINDERIHSKQEIFAFGIGHAEIASQLLSNYGFSNEICLAVQAYDSPFLTNNPLALLLYVSDSIARAETSLKIVATETLGPDRLSWLGISRGDLALIHSFLTDNLNLQALAA